VSDAKRSELLAQNLLQDLKDATAAFVPRPRQQDLPSFGQVDWPFSRSCLRDQSVRHRQDRQLAIFTVQSVPSCFSETPHTMNELGL